MLLNSFIEVVAYLNDDPGFYYSYGTRKNKMGRPAEKARVFGQGIQERSRNFLAIALINLAAMTIPPRGAAKIFSDAQKVSQNSLPNRSDRAHSIISFSVIPISGLANTRDVLQRHGQNYLSSRSHNTRVKTG
jgi:hypothetical protein